MNNFQQRGDVLSIIAAANTASGQVVAVGQLLGVAANAAAVGQPLEVNLVGVYLVPKVTNAVINAGDSLLWDVSAGKFDAKGAAPAAGDVSGASAVAFQPAGNGATAVAVRFTGVPGTVAA